MFLTYLSVCDFNLSLSVFLTCLSVYFLSVSMSVCVFNLCLSVFLNLSVSVCMYVPSY